MDRKEVGAQLAEWRELVKTGTEREYSEAEAERLMFISLTLVPELAALMVKENDSAVAIGKRYAELLSLVLKEGDKNLVGKVVNQAVELIRKTYDENRQNNKN